MSTLGPDILRLTAIPIFLIAAVTDFRTRRVPPRLWIIAIVLGMLAAMWDLSLIAPIETTAERWTVLQITFLPILVGLIGAVAMIVGSLGGADLKGLFVLGLLFPTTPAYTLSASLTLPIYTHPELPFVISIAANGLIIGAIYPLRMWGVNLLRGERSWDLISTTEKTVPELRRTAGQLLVPETTDESDHVAVDIDALRMYLRWRKTDFKTLDEYGDAIRTAEIGSTTPVETGAMHPPSATTGHPVEEIHTLPDKENPDTDDVWDADRFLSDIAHHAYDTTPDELRAALTYLSTHEAVRVEPSFPLMPPLAVGLITALTVGNLITVIL